jgi:hypothetical protein
MLGFFLCVVRSGIPVAVGVKSGHGVNIPGSAELLLRKLPFGSIRHQAQR